MLQTYRAGTSIAPYRPKTNQAINYLFLPNTEQQVVYCTHCFIVRSTSLTAPVMSFSPFCTYITSICLKTLAVAFLATDALVAKKATYAIVKIFYPLILDSRFPTVSYKKFLKICRELTVEIIVFLLQFVCENIFRHFSRSIFYLEINLPTIFYIQKSLAIYRNKLYL